MCAITLFRLFTAQLLSLLFCAVGLGNPSSWYATYKLSVDLSETLSTQDQQLLSAASACLYNIKGKGTLSLTVNPRGITAKYDLPAQISRPQQSGELSKTVQISYLIHYSKDGYLLIGEGKLEATHNWNNISQQETIPINSVLIWKPTPATIFLGNPTGYLASQWQPEIGVLLLLAGVDPEVLGLQRMSRNASEYVLETGNIYITAKYQSRQNKKLLARVVLSKGKEKFIYNFMYSNKYKHAIPSSIQLLSNSINKNYKVQFNLVDVDHNPPSQSDALGIPHGVTVNDFRHLQEPATPEVLTEERAVKYLWRGRIPTSPEVVDLALRQGRTLPPHTPSARYSLFLFLPALVFFALAAYFYFRGKRQ